jgi:hypothetical protein
LPKALASVMPLISDRHFGGGPKQRLTSLGTFQGHKLDICQLPDRWPSKPTAYLDDRSATQRRAERFCWQETTIGWPQITGILAEYNRFKNWELA